MTSLLARCVVVVVSISQVTGQALITHGPPKVDQNPVFLDSYVPAAMQVISHLTELMKYEVTPSKKPATTSAPYTSSHRPGLYAPLRPPVPTTKPKDFAKLGEEPQSPYFTMYRLAPKNFDDVDRVWTYSDQPPKKSPRSFPKDLDFIGTLTSDLYKLVNADNYEDFDDGDGDAELAKFSENYDDNFIGQLRQKKVPPTRAYVTLLSLYDNLNKEAKKLNLNKYNGYSKGVLEVLSDTSSGTSAAQLHTIMVKILERRDVSQHQTVTKIETLKKDLEQTNSYINDALRYIPPLAFDIFSKDSHWI